MGFASSMLFFSDSRSEHVRPTLSSSLEMVRFATRCMGFLGIGGLSCERFEMLNSQAIDPMPIKRSSSATVWP